MQKPFFKGLGLDIDHFYNGTINAMLERCSAVEILKADIELIDVKWSKHHQAESFQFINCSILFGDRVYKSMIYQPKKSTKIGHLQPNNVIEILAPKIAQLHYGDKIVIDVSSQNIKFHE
ncbi:hypothetical protein [Colwellia sp. MEBiC06753]